MKKILLLSLLFLCFSFLLDARENLSDLLALYKERNDLSNITKKEAAGLLDIYTRDDLEKMQARTLMDVLKTLPDIYAGRSYMNLTTLTRPTMQHMPSTAVRLYINDHDMTSSSSGSAFLIWGNMPIEYIDHIEVYKATSSIEFGNENAVIIIKLYTKSASRENGGKVRLSADNLGSFEADAYYAQEIDSDLSYILYAEGNDEKRKVYHNTYAQKEYDIKSGNDAANFYGNIAYKNWLVELGSYHRKNDTFVGIGNHQTPDGGDLRSRHTYGHVTGKFDGDLKVQLAVDDIAYEGTFSDENNITITANGQLVPIRRSELDYHDKILSLIVEKVFHNESSKLLVGGFYKYKYFDQKGRYRGGFVDTTSDFSNSVDLFSLYIEENYDFDTNTRLIASFKGDFFRYKKEVRDRDEYIFRLGAIKNIDNVKLKLFFTKSYIPVPFWQLYNEDKTPVNANPRLKYPEIEVAAASVTYDSGNLLSTFELTAHEAENLVIPFVDRSLLKQVYINSDKKLRFYSVVLKERYEFDAKNRLLLELSAGSNSERSDYSPKYGVTLRLFNRYKKFDIYNELIYRSSYTGAATLNLMDMHYVESSFDFTTAVKYHYTKDLLLGVRAENIFDDSMKMYYGGGLQPIEVFDRKIWANLEYMF